MRVLVISPFPDKKRQTVSYSALGVYTKRLLGVLPKNNQYTIACQNSNKSYTFGGYVVKPVWRRDNPLFVWDLLKEGLRSNYSCIHIQHEVYGYGTNQYIFPYLLIVLILVLRVFRKKVVVTVHGVLPLKILQQEFIKNSGVVSLSWLVKFGSFIMYYFTCLFANKVIVHSQKLKEYLVKDYKVNIKKIFVIPHPLYKFSSGQVVSAKYERLTKNFKYVFLYFGYLSMYKSLDVLLNAYSRLPNKNRDSCLLISGTIPKRLEGNNEYKLWVQSFKDKYSSLDSVLWDTRFIPNNEMRHYFTNASALVIPYKFLVSSSGPLAFAIDSNLPVLASNSFSGVIQKELIYGSTAEDLANSIYSFTKSKSSRDKIKSAVRMQKEFWSDSNIAKLYSDFYQNL